MTDHYDGIVRTTLFTLRQPTVSSAELVVTHLGKTKVYPLSFTQARLLNAQSAKAIAHWPVVEK